MNSERLPKRYKKELTSLGVPLATVGLLFIASLGAFSRKVKYEIHKRDNFICIRCGASHPLEAGHVNHDKRNPKYNTVDNGDTFCPECHLKDHIENAGHNGLSKRTNDWAIERLKERA